MIISQIDIRNFRNLINVNSTFHHKTNLFIGNNGQGKTNLLEAIGFLASGRSFRTTRENELINWNEKFSRLESSIERNESSLTILLTLTSDGEHCVKKKMFLDGVPLSRLSQFIGKIKIVPFSRQDLSIVTGPPAERRRYLNAILAASNPGYLYALQHYCAIIKERNLLLRTSKYGAHPVMNEVWEERLSYYGSQIMLCRMELISRLNLISSKIFREFSREKETIKLDYKPTFSPVQCDQGELQRSFFQQLKKTRALENDRRVTLTGPHRDELAITLNNAPLRSFGSQGQQRFAVVALKLAECELLDSRSDEPPLVLLDDCFSELDEERRRLLWDYVKKKGQVFITSNDLPLIIESFEDSYIFKVSEGRIAERVQKP